MIEEATGVTLELEFRPYAEALGALAEGERFLFLSWGEAPQVADPTDRWRDTLHSAGARNWGGVSDSGAGRADRSDDGNAGDRSAAPTSRRRRRSGC